MMYPDAVLRKIFTKARTFVCVGASAKPERPSHEVSCYLKAKGYRVIPVNPGLEGQVLFDERVLASVTQIHDPVDVIDIFRRSETVPDIVKDTIEHLPTVQVIWMQLGVQNAQARQFAENHGLTVIENRCPKIDYQRLFGNQNVTDIRP